MGFRADREARTRAVCTRSMICKIAGKVGALVHERCALVTAARNESLGPFPLGQFSLEQRKAFINQQDFVAF